MKEVDISTLIFSRMQNCVKWHKDTCFPVQNTQKVNGKSGRVYNVCRAGEDIPGESLYGADKNSNGQQKTPKRKLRGF